MPVFEELFREVENIYPDAPDKLQFNETIRRMLDRLVSDLIRNTQQRLRTAGIRTPEQVRVHPERLAALSAGVEEERRDTKSFLYDNLYFSPALADEKDDAEIVIDGEVWPDIENGEFVVQLAPGRHRVEIRRSGFRTFTTEIDVRGGQTAPLNVNLTKE